MRVNCKHRAPRAMFTLFCCGVVRLCYAFHAKEWSDRLQIGLRGPKRHRRPRRERFPFFYGNRDVLNRFPSPAPDSALGQESNQETTRHHTDNRFTPTSRLTMEKNMTIRVFQTTETRPYEVFMHNRSGSYMTSFWLRKLRRLCKKVSPLNTSLH